MFRLQLQAAFASRIGKRRNSSVVPAGATIQSDRFYAGRKGLLSNCLADRRSRIAIASAASSGRLVFGGSRSNRQPLLVVNQLTRKVLQGSVYTQPRTLSVATNLVSNSKGSALSLVIDDLFKLHDWLACTSICLRQILADILLFQ